MEIPAARRTRREPWSGSTTSTTPRCKPDIAEYVNYVTLVAGVKEILRERDPELARNPDLPEREQVGELLVRAGARWRAGRAGDRGFRERHGLSLRTLSIAALQTPRSRRPRGDARAVRRAAAHVRGIATTPSSWCSRSSTWPHRRSCSTRATATPSRSRRDPRTADRAARRDRRRVGRLAGRRARCTSAPARPNPQHGAVESRPKASWSPPTARSSRGSPTRPPSPGDRVRHLRDTRGPPGGGWRSVTTASFPETFRQLAWLGAEVVISTDADDDQRPRCRSW